MDEQKFAAISHIDLAFCSPISASNVEHVIDRIPMQPGARVLDVGCGKGEVLLRIAARCQVKATGIDDSSYFLQEAHEEIAARAPGADIALREIAFAHFDAVPNSYDVVVCVRSAELFGSYESALQTLKALVKPGGYLMVGARYWKQPPTDDHRAAFGPSAQSIYDYAGTIQIGASEGLTPRYVAVSSVADWDHYRWSHVNALERYAVEHSDDLMASAMLQKSRMIRDRYLAYERDVMGFGLYMYYKGGA